MRGSKKHWCESREGQHSGGKWIYTGWKKGERGRSAKDMNMMEKKVRRKKPKRVNIELNTRMGDL